MDKKWIFIIEIFGGLAVFWGINMFFWNSNPGFIDIRPHPYLFLVILITTRYGYARGLGAVFFSSLSYLGAALVRGFSFNYTLWAPVVYFFIFTTIIGIIIDNFFRKSEKDRETIRCLSGAADSLKEENSKLEEAHFELSQRLIAEKSTFSILYRIARKLNTLDRELLLGGIIEMVQSVIGGENCAVFFLEGHKLKLAKVYDRERLRDVSIDQEVVGRVLKEKKTFSIKDSTSPFEGREVFIYGPFLEGSHGDPVGIIVVLGLDFLRYNPTSVSLFNLLCDWASISLGNISETSGRCGQELIVLGETFTGLFDFAVDSESVKEIVDSLC